MEGAVMDEAVSSPEAADLAGITYRQLDYWVRTNVVRPVVRAAGPGSRRLIRREDIPRLRLLGRLQRQLGEQGGGVTAPLARRLMRDYTRGVMHFDGFTLLWRVEDE